MVLELVENPTEVCKEPSCVLLRVNTGRRPVDTIGVHIHPGRNEPLPRLLGAAVAKLLQDSRLSP
jgi:hypothetical protein